MSESLAFYAADTLNDVLYQTKDGLTSMAMKRVLFGPWQIDVMQEAASDIISPKELSFWVRLGKLRLYLVIKEKESFLMVLDALVMEEMTLPTTESSLYERLRQIKPAIKATWQYDLGRWTKITTR